MPAIVPFLPAIIGAAGAIGGGLLSKKANYGGPSAPEQAQLDNQNKLISNITGKADTLFPQGQSLLNLSTNTFQRPLDYWGSILGGDRGAALSTLAPQVNQINEANASNTNALANLAPRSGASPDFRAASIYNPQKQITSLLQTARPQAANALGTLAGQTGSLGSYITGDSLRSLSGAAGSSNNLLDSLLKERVNQQNQQGSLGSSIGNLLYTITKGISGKDGGVSPPSGGPGGTPGGNIDWGSIFGGK